MSGIGIAISTDAGGGLPGDPPPPPPGPVNTVLPVISGTAQHGQELSVTSGTWEGTGTISYAYQWRRSGGDISGATGTAYTLTEADVGETMTCRVTATDSEGSRTVVSAPTAEVAAMSALVNTALPVISGSAYEGSTLNVSNGSWSGEGPVSYAYQWERSGTAISGATSASYLLVAADLGATLTCVVSATNPGGTVSAESAATAVVGAAPASQSLLFNGTSGYLSMSSADWGSYDRNKFAVALAFRSPVISGSSRMMVSRNSTSTVTQREWMIYTGTSKIYFQIYNTSGLVQAALVTNPVLSNDHWHSLMVHFDRQNTTTSLRLRMWLDGAEMTVFDTQNMPTLAVNNGSSQTQIGNSTFTTGLHWNGEIHQPAFFSGALPDPADVFDAVSGKLKDLSGLAGLYSYNPAVEDAVSDSVRTADWTNNGSVSTTAVIP